MQRLFIDIDNEPSLDGTIDSNQASLQPNRGRFEGWKWDES
jgi:hypothetical protein